MKIFIGALVGLFVFEAFLWLAAADYPTSRGLALCIRVYGDCAFAFFGAVCIAIHKLSE